MGAPTTLAAPSCFRYTEPIKKMEAACYETGQLGGLGPEGAFRLLLQAVPAVLQRHLCSGCDGSLPLHKSKQAFLLLLSGVSLHQGYQSRGGLPIYGRPGESVPAGPANFQLQGPEAGLGDFPHRHHALWKRYRNILSNRQGKESGPDHLS